MRFLKTLFKGLLIIVGVLAALWFLTPLLFDLAVVVVSDLLVLASKLFEALVMLIFR